MNLHRHQSIAEFLAAATPFLLRWEIEHGLMLSVAADAVRSLSTRGDPYWAVVLDGERVVAAALRTSLKMLLSHEGEPGAMALIAADAMQYAPSAILGPAAAVDAFALASGATWNPGRANRIYELRSVRPPAASAGAMRVARAEDRATLVEWMLAFAMEADGRSADAREISSMISRRTDEGAMYLWEVDGTPAASAGAVGATPHGIRITAVYTPASMRRRGYASSLVAALSQRMLDAGREFVFLYTDIANPTSNAIYQRIGYRPVADAREAVMGSLNHNSKP
ncbi:MAG: GNAT family N-acetyltransferase [Gemmatimonadota bacterium]|nr:GNAT family N-acetyltransferase [Gemmatimonadota bacterium]